MMTLHFVEILLFVACFLLSGFCFSLTRKLRRLNNLESGIGGAIAVLIGEIARLEKSILSARSEALKATAGLSEEIERAKQEKAYWVLQQKFAPLREGKLLTTKRRRMRQTEGNDA
ncbi:hypothetical protein [Paracoccus cavernae]|uniref:hypothetical protein n=1 Tax=Paracoccus cavernae TaxID=1571207 RepID=UPI00360E58E4